MHEANPFSDNTIWIDESSPLSTDISRKEIEGIAIWPNKKDYEAKPKYDELSKLLALIERPEAVKLIEIDYNSKIVNLPDLSRFKNIEYFHVAGRKIKDVSILSKFSKLKNLFLVNYKPDKIPALSVDKLNGFRAIRGGLERIDFNSDYFFLQQCSKLTWFEKIQSNIIELEVCHKVDLDTLGNVAGLRKLSIIGRKNMDNLSFINKCPQLIELEIAGTDLRNTNVSGLNMSHTLKKCFIGVSDKLIKDIAMRSPSILITNGDIMFKGHDEIKYDYNYYHDY